MNSRGIAVVGCGQWGKNIARNFQQLGALTAVCDLDVGRAAEVGQKLDVPVGSFEDILSAQDISGIAIATAPASHAPLAFAALHAGKHLFIEKPLALSIADAEAICEKSRVRRRIVLVGHLMQYHPAFLKLKELVARGDLGRIRHISCSRLNLGRIRREEDVLWSFAPHDVSMILALAAEAPTSVRAEGHCYLHPTIADVTLTVLNFPSGVNAHIFVSWLHPFKEQKLVVVGERAMALFDDGLAWERKLTLFPHEVLWKNGTPQAKRAEGQAVALEPAEPLKLECTHFLRCLQGAEQPRTDAEEGLRVLRVLDAAAREMGSRAAATKVHVSRPERFFVHDSSYVDEDCDIGEGTKIWHFSHIVRGTKIGKNCVIGQNVMIGPDVVVGESCKIQNNVSIYKGVELGRGVFCGPSCVFTNVFSPRAEIERKHEFRKTVVGDGVTIGANATIVCGVVLGEYCFVGAGAVVTADVAPFGLVVGNPARQVGWVSHAGEKMGGDLVCPRSGRKYVLSSGSLMESIVG